MINAQDPEDRRKLRTAALLLVKHALLALRPPPKHPITVKWNIGRLMTEQDADSLISAMKEILDEADVKEPVRYFDVESDYGALGLLRQAAARSGVKLRWSPCRMDYPEKPLPWDRGGEVYLPDKFVMAFRGPECWFNNRTLVILRDAEPGHMVMG